MSDSTDKFSLQERKMEIQGLIIAAEQNRIEMQRAWQNLEKLQTALQSAKELRDGLMKKSATAGKMKK